MVILCIRSYIFLAVAQLQRVAHEQLSAILNNFAAFGPCEPRWIMSAKSWCCTCTSAANCMLLCKNFTGCFSNPNLFWGLPKKSSYGMPLPGRSSPWIIVKQNMHRSPFCWCNCWGLTIYPEKLVWHSGVSGCFFATSEATWLQFFGTFATLIIQSSNPRWKFISTDVN